MEKKKTIEVTRAEYNYLLNAVETLTMLTELDPIKNSAEDYRDAICAILEMRGWR